MSRDQDGRNWRIARLLFAAHLPFLVLVWAVVAVAVAAVTAGIALLGTVTGSVWDPASSILRWFALGYGTHLTGTLLPTYVAHGQTRRDSMVQITLFVVVATAVFSALMALGYGLEALLYGAMDWPQDLQRLFTSATQVPLVLITYWGMFGAWTIAGALLAAGFYRSKDVGVVTIPIALVLVIVVGDAVGFPSLPLVGGIIATADMPLPLTIALCAATFLLGVAVTWGFARDLPLRNRTG